MGKIYRCVIVGLMVILIVWGVWYVFSCFKEQGSHEDGVLGRVEREIGNGTGNSIY